MRLLSSVFHNVGPFKHFELNLAALDESALLVALVGPNGIGKTFTMETAMPGVLYRHMRTQGTLIGRATARDSYVESRVVNGQPWRIRHDLDGVSRKGEATVWGEDGLPAYEGTKVSTFEKWAKQHLISEDVMFSTLFAAQGSEGFIELGSGDRISVILQVIGVAQLERLAEGARKRATAERTKLAALRQRIQDARAGALEPEAAATALAAARVHVERVVYTEERLTRELAAAEAEERRLGALREVAERAATAAAARVTLIDAARVKVADLDERIQNNRAMLADGPAVRAAAAELPKLRAGIEAADKEAAAAGQRVALVQADLDRLLDQCADAHRGAEEAKQAVARLEARLRDEPGIAKAAAALAECRAASERAAADVTKAEAQLEALRGTRLAGAEERIGGLRAGHTRICEEDTLSAREISASTLRADDQAVQASTEAPTRLATAAERVRATKDTAAAAQRLLTATERLAARAPDMAVARTELTAATALVATSAARLTEASEAMRLRTDDLAPAELALSTAAATSVRLRAALAKAEPVAAQAETLAGASARLAVHEPNAALARAELARLEAEHAATPPAERVADAVDLGPARATLAETSTAARKAQADLARAEQRSEQAAAAAERASALDAERLTVEADLGDFVRLAADLGRDGIQSAEVDSAGPELTELVNDLLHTCHGPRFSISIETTRASADGKDQIDECGVLVTDTLGGGRVREAREFSGGERVILGEAVSLGLTMLACRRSGVQRPTLFRDESGAALDADNQRVYVAMLRRAAEMVGADRVLFVSHSEEVIALADAQIRLEDAA